MKPILTAFLGTILAVSQCHAAPAAPLTVRDLPGKRVMFLGDSITQDGRYIGMTEYYLETLNRKADFDIIGLGLASETTSGLTEDGHAGGAFPRPCVHERLGRALDKVKPQIVIACYGINDGIYQELEPARFKAFQDGMTRLVSSAQAAHARVVLMTPPIFDAATGSWARYKDYDNVLVEYARWVMEPKSLPQTLRIDLHTAMRQALKDHQQAEPNFHFATDGVHPNDLGHLLMAHKLLEGLGLKLPQGPTATELARIKADPLYAQIDQRRRQRSAAWMNYVGYTRERVVPPGNNITAAEQQAAKLQQQIDTLRRK